MQPESVVEYWFGPPGSKPNFKLWFQSDKNTDKEIAERFGPAVETALEGIYMAGILHQTA